MYVVATAGHVDHGKSTLVRALSGMEPDRWAEERRRGMTIDLGFAWTTLGNGETVAFVDVPGHERFVPNMLAGIGPVPAAMIVVAADEGWMPQSAEHLAALDALDVRHALLVVTRSDLADPRPATEQALAEIARTSLGLAANRAAGEGAAGGRGVEAVAVSGLTGAGLPELRAALQRLTARLPEPDPTVPVRLWVDRAFTVKGAGTVVTGTLGGGVLRKGDQLELGGTAVTIRGMQTLGEPADRVEAVARVAVNLRGVDRQAVGRGSALLTPRRFRHADLIDVRIHGDQPKSLPSTLTLHVGSAAVAVAVRPLGDDTARLRLTRPLPLRIGDRALLRDPGRHHVAGGVTVLDVSPPALTRRGAAVRRAAELAVMTGVPDLAAELGRRRLIRGIELTGMGVPLDGVDPVTGDWYADPGYWDAKGEQMRAELSSYKMKNPLEPGAPIEALRHLLDLPDRDLVTALIKPPLRIIAGRVAEATTKAPEVLMTAVNRAFEGIPPFVAPEANDLAALGLGPRQIAAAAREGLVVKIADNVILRPEDPERAAETLAGIPQPFTLSEARKALGTTRRVAVPLLELLDRTGLTRRLPDDRRMTSSH
ncbi:selenocysteine-specific translation elongation factor [Actinoplanes sp. OR16]|uniref:selenocysteine-specific translation elongation factor n=1 Tax=Actinoplanes sp. OR16 TaxID=946334 RepID=UPI000F6DF0E8|nr:selenocysteine-specific translation elongation factor [Actinoplanes sp. OR16]BBH71688.1 selenocysteine-specific translation elongation factor [Actinoplanes sp. OR16]